eukprot:gene1034-360_t
MIKRIRDLESKDQQRLKAIDDLEPYGRRDMVEIGGIPRQNEINIVVKIADKLKVSVVSSDIEACHRISPKENASIIVELKSRKLKDALLSKEAKRIGKKLRISDLGFQMAARDGSEDAGKVFINESLTSRIKNLLRLTKIKKRELDFKFVWTRNGCIYIRKNESAQVQKINFPGDLEKLA